MRSSSAASQSRFFQLVEAFRRHPVSLDGNSCQALFIQYSTCPYAASNEIFPQRRKGPFRPFPPLFQSTTLRGRKRRKEPKIVTRRFARAKQKSPNLLPCNRLELSSSAQERIRTSTAKDGHWLLKPAWTLLISPSVASARGIEKPRSPYIPHSVRFAPVCVGKQHRDFASSGPL